MQIQSANPTEDCLCVVLFAPQLFRVQDPVHHAVMRFIHDIAKCFLQALVRYQIFYCSAHSHIIDNVVQNLAIGLNTKKPQSDVQTKRRIYAD